MSRGAHRVMVRVSWVLSAVLLAGFASTGCTRAAQVRTMRPEPLPPTERDAVPSGTLTTAQLRQSLSTSRSREGDRFTAELLEPLVDAEGREWVGRGAVVEGVVQRTDASSIAGDRAALDVAVLGLRSPGVGLIPIEAEVAQAPVTLEPVWRRSFLGGVAGAAAGSGVALALDDRSGVVLGAALVGAGVGALASWFFGRRDAELPSGSVMTLRLTQELRLDRPIDPRAIVRAPVREDTRGAEPVRPQGETAPLPAVVRDPQTVPPGGAR